MQGPALFSHADNDPLNKTDPIGLRPGDETLTVRHCSDLTSLILPGETLWQGLQDGACIFTPSDVNLNSPCFWDQDLRQNTVDYAFAMLNGITLGQADHIVGSESVCEEGFEVFVGELVGSTLTLGLAGKGIAALGSTNSVCKPGNFARGFAIEEKLYKPAELLAKNFPAIDRVASGIATSIKSIDLTAKSYQSAGALTRQLTKYIDEVAGLNGQVLNGFTRSGARIAVDTGRLAGRELVVAIEPGVASVAQRQAIQQVISYGSQRGVNVIVKTVRKEGHRGSRGSR
jgi:hypothetical protein